MKFSEISFNDVPQALVYLIKKVENLESMLSKNHDRVEDEDRWFNLEELKQYHPDRPASATVYAWVNQKKIPYHKKGKKLMFLKSEVDAYLKSGKQTVLIENSFETQKSSSVRQSGLGTPKIHLINPKSLK